MGAAALGVWAGRLVALAVVAVFLELPEPALAVSIPVNPATSGAYATAPPGPLLAPAPRATLSEAHEYELQSASVRMSFWRDFWHGVGSTLVALAWPATLGLIGWFAWRAYDAYLPRLQRESVGEREQNRSQAVQANMNFEVSAAELQEVNEAAETLVTALGLLQKTTPKISTLGMMAAVIPPELNAAIEPPRKRIASYAVRISDAILARQLAVLTMCSTRQLTYGEALSSFRAAQADGYDGDFWTWMNFLSRTGLAREVTTSTAMSTVIAATDLGRLVIGWCEANRISSNTLMHTDRGL